MSDIRIVPATGERFADVGTLLGPRGGPGGCWCMLWRMKRKDYDAAGAEGRKAAMQAVFASDRACGLLAYDGETPVGWCSIAPRSAFPRLEGSRILAPVDDAPVWSITCFFIARDHRRGGLSVRLLGAAADHVVRLGGSVVEGYPVDPDRKDYPAAYAWVGLAGAYRKAGFQEVARRSPTRPIMRRYLG